MKAPRVASAVARTTSMTAMIVVKVSTRDSERNDTRSKPPAPPCSEVVASLMVEPTVLNTPMVSSTDHSTATATIEQTPSAMDSRKLTFITDHGSAFETRRRALRVRGPVRAAGRGLRTPAAAGDPGPDPGPAPVPPAGGEYADGGWCGCGG